MDSKDFSKSPHKWSHSPIRAAGQGLGTLVSPGRPEQGQKWVYKQKITNIYCQVTLTILTI